MFQVSLVLIGNIIPFTRHTQSLKGINTSSSWLNW